MTWAKFDDRYDDHKKVKRAWRRERAAIGLHVMAVTYCARHETDGLVDLDWIVDRLPQERERLRVLGVLIDVGLFEVVDAERWLVHDYLDYHDSHETLSERRRREAARKAAARASGRTPDSAGSPSGVRADNGRTPAGHEAESGDPDPTRPDPTAPTPLVEPERPDVTRLCHRLADAIVANNPKAKPQPDGDVWQTAMRLLIDRGAHDEAAVAAVIDWCQADEFWRSNILSAAKLREKFDQLTLKMKASGVRRAIGGRSGSAKPAHPRDDARRQRQHDAIEAMQAALPDWPHLTVLTHVNGLLQSGREVTPEAMRVRRAVADPDWTDNSEEAAA